jgi:hypothetical protein
MEKQEREIAERLEAATTLLERTLSWLEERQGALTGEVERISATVEQSRRANPVLLDLIDREMKAEFNVVLNTDTITGGIRVKMLSTQAGDLPLIPDWSLSYTGTPGSGTAVLPAYIVTEDLIEYHWLGDPTPRIFQLGLPNSLAHQYVAVKFGAPVVKGANYAHYQVLVDR